MPGLGKSDHVQLVFDYNCYIEVNRHLFKKYNFFKGDYTGLSVDLVGISWDTVLDGLDLANLPYRLRYVARRLVGCFRLNGPLRQSRSRSSNTGISSRQGRYDPSI